MAELHVSRVSVLEMSISVHSNNTYKYYRSASGVRSGGAARQSFSIRSQNGSMSHEQRGSPACGMSRMRGSGRPVSINCSALTPYFSRNYSAHNLASRAGRVRPQGTLVY